MKNIRNYGMVTGRLVRDFKVCNNRDGSRKILFTVATANNYKSKDGHYHSQFISLEAFVPGNQKDNGVFAYINGGDLITCSYSVQTNTYTNKDGNTVYGQVLMVNDVALLESKATKEARRAKATQAKAVKNETTKETKQAKAAQAKAVKNETAKEIKKSTRKQAAA